MKIQLALDRLTKDECFQILNETIDYIDLIEVGTGVIKEYGMAIIKKIKSAYPDKKLVADMKTCDAGASETTQAFEAGADITTVMAFSSDETIVDCLDVANSYNKEVMIDLLGVTNPNKIVELKSLGVELLSLHVGKDMQKSGETTNFNFDIIQNKQAFKIAVAGGINVNSLPQIAPYKPDNIIVGNSITKAEDKKAVASKMKGWITDYENDH